MEMQKLTITFRFLLIYSQIYYKLRYFVVHEANFSKFTFYFFKYMLANYVIALNTLNLLPLHIHIVLI